MPQMPHPHSTLIRLMSFMLVPLACWQVWIFPFIPYYHLQHLFAYPVCLYFVWLLGSGQIRLAAIYHRWLPRIPLALLIVLLQTTALWYNTPQPETALSLRLLNVGLALCKVVLMWPMLLIVGEICLFTVQRPFALRASALGCAYSSLALLLLCLVQGVAIYTVDAGNSQLQALHHEYCAPILRAISPYIEARWKEVIYDFYSQGAYSLTTFRINGFFEEVSALAAWIGTFFLPLSFGCIFVRSLRETWLHLCGWISAIAWIIILFLARSTTGQIIAIAALLLLLLFSLRGKAKIFTCSLAILCMGLCVVISLYAPYVSAYLQNRIKYGEMSTLPRIIIMRDTVDSIGKHPLTGIGRGNFSAHIVQGKRFKAQLAHDSELSAWERAKSVPPLSALLGFTVQYGIPLTLLLLLGMARLCFTLYRQWRARPHQPLAQFAFAGYSAWCVLAGITTFGSLDLRNPLFMLPLCTFIALAHWQKTLPAEGHHAP